MKGDNLAAIIAAATKANVSAYHSKFGAKSLDEKMFDDGELTRLDRLVKRVFDDEIDAGENQWDYEGLTIRGDAARRRSRAEAGRGWLSSLDQCGVA